jgi:hypothetical protein
VDDFSNILEPWFWTHAYDNRTSFSTLFLSLSSISTLYHGFFRLQEKNPDFCVKKFWQNFLDFSYSLAYHLLHASIVPKSNGTRFATAICRKSLQRKHLRRFFGRDFDVSPYAVRVYVKSLYSSVQAYTPTTVGMHKRTLSRMARYAD